MMKNFGQLEKKRWNSDYTRYIVRYKGRRIGGAKVYCCQVEDVLVNSRYRRRGVATMLLTEIIKDWGHLELDLMADAEEGIKPADLRKFYRKFGFKSGPDCHDLMYREAKKIS